MKKLTTGVLVLVLSSSMVVLNAQEKKNDSARTQIIEEVVVTGALGIKRKADAVTNAQQVVNAKELNQASAPNAVQSLTGKVSGLTITQTNSAVDATNRITLRGSKSITGNNQALVVIDNVISDASVLASLPPEVIDNVNVVKGLQGAALYGSQGVNGVIIVTTKKGSKSERMQFNLTSSVEMSQGFNFPKIQTKYGKGVQDESYSNADFGGTNFVPWENTSWGPAYNDPTIGGTYVPSGLPQENSQFIFEKYAPVKNHFSRFFTNGISFQNGVSMNVGGSDSYAFLSINRLESNFIVQGDQLKQNNFLFKAGKKLGNLRIDGQLNYISRIVNKTDSGLYGDITEIPSTNDIRKYKNSGIEGYLTAYATNPYWTAEHARFDSNRDYLNGILALQYDFNEHINLSYTGNISMTTNKMDNHNDGFSDPRVYQNTGVAYLDNSSLSDLSSPDVNSFYYNRTYNDRKYYGDLMLNFNYDLSENINFKANLGNNIQDTYSTARTVGGTGLRIPGWYDVRNLANASQYADANIQADGGLMDNYLTRLRIFAMYANVDLSYKDYLFLNGTFRYEQSSVFSSTINGEFNNKPYPFYSIGAAFVPTKAFPSIKGNFLNYLKIAPSFTRVGNSYGVLPYENNIVGSIPTGFPYGSLPSYVQNVSPTTPDISPEFVNTADLNVQIGLFRDRVTLEGSVYQSDTDDLITYSNVSSASGLSRLKTNVGKSRMKGFEVDLGVTPIKTRNFTWNLKANYSMSRTKIMDLADGINEVALLSYTTPGVGIFAVKGENFPVIKGTTYQRDPNGNIIVDANGVPLVSTALSNLGRVTPDYVLGLSTSLKFKGFTLSSVMDFRKGGKFVSFTKRTLAFTGALEESANYDRSLGYVVPNSVQLVNGAYVPNTTAAYGADYSGSTTYWSGSTYGSTGENLVVDATAFKIREISLMYDFPKSVLNSTFVSALSVSLYARNPIAIYAKENRNFADPETASTNGNGAGIALGTQYPTLRTFGLKLNATF